MQQLQRGNGAVDGAASRLVSTALSTVKSWAKLIVVRVVVAVLAGVLLVIITPMVLPEKEGEPPVEVRTQPEATRASVSYTVAEIIEAMEGLTDIQQQSLLPRYVGEPIEETGVVSNVSELSNGLWLRVRVDEHPVIASGLTDERIATLNLGEVVRFRADVLEADDYSIEVENLELIKISDPPSPDDGTPEREWSTPRYAVWEILAALQGHTNLEIERRVESHYEGESVEFMGYVRNVYSGFAGGYYVSVDDDESRVSAHFSSSDEIAHLQIGDMVWVRGFVGSSTGDSTVFMDDSHVVRDEPPPSQTTDEP